MTSSRFTRFGKVLSQLDPVALAETAVLTERFLECYAPQERRLGRELRADVESLLWDGRGGIFGARFTRAGLVAMVEPVERLVFCRCPQAEHGACVHGYAAAAEALERIGAELERRAELAEDWEGNLARLDGFLAPDRAPLEGEPDRRVVWRVGVQDGLEVKAFEQRRRTSGSGFTKGRGLTFQRLIHERALWTTPETRALAEQVTRHARRLGTHYQLDPHQALLALVGSPRVSWDHAPERGVQVERASLTLRLEPAPLGALRLAASFGGVPVEATAELCEESPIAYPLLDEDRVLVGHADAQVLRFLRQFPPEARVFPAAARDALCARLDALERQVPLEIPGELQAPRADAQSEVSLALRPLPNGVEVRAVVVPAAGADPLAPGEGEDEVARWEEGKRSLLRRDLGAEAESARALREKLGLPTPRGGSWTWRTQGEEAVELLARLDALAEVERQWLGPEVQVSRPAGVRDLKLEVKERRDWFGLEGTVEVQGWDVPLVRVLKALRQGERHVRVDAQRWLRLEEGLLERLRRIAVLIGNRPTEVSAELGIHAAPALADLLSDVPEPVLCSRWEAVAQRLRDAQAIPDDPPPELRAELRPYQRRGAAWLRRLASWGMGAVLADDMGLGKTVQAIAVLLARAAEGPALVVAPTSLGANWRRELARFAPSLRVQIWRETARDVAAVTALGPGDVLITSYDLARINAVAFHARPWSSLVFDEAQRVKNAATRTAQALRELRGEWRLALSGTPVENALGELWALFRLVSPGLLGSWQTFQDRYAAPIERNGDRARQAELAERVRPFVLRRTKAEVLSELPPRTEVRVEVELTPKERELYEGARLAALLDFERLTPGQDLPQPRFQVLAALTRLRQLACHVSLVDEDWREGSSKLRAFLELREELAGAGHRALVFSQFTRHLRLVRAALHERGVETLYLDGSTPARQRQELVDRFQEGEGEVFLISLKAGGTGLNLTEASYVVHLDPWWNPAVEDQATDRAHRIGQTKPVTVYRLVSSDTIEEQILALHETKRDLSSSVLSGANQAGRLSTDELVHLIRWGGQPLPTAADAPRRAAELAQPPPEPERPASAPAYRPQAAGPEDEWDFSFSEAVREQRRRHRLSQKAMAARLGVSAGTLRRWEKGGEPRELDLERRVREQLFAEWRLG